MNTKPRPENKLAKVLGGLLIVVILVVQYFTTTSLNDRGEDIQSNSQRITSLDMRFVELDKRLTNFTVDFGGRLFTCVDPDKDGNYTCSSS